MNELMAFHLRKEKDLRPYWETDHRGLMIPLVKSGYNNSSSYALPLILGGSGPAILDDILNGRTVDLRELEHGAGDAAGMAMTGGFALGSRPRNSVGMFAGRFADTADHPALAKAEQMQAAGAPREQIWNDTGWFRGMDDKWRFEIGDETLSTPVGHNVLRHTNLESAYPRMRLAAPKEDQPAGGPGDNILSSIYDGQQGGTYNPKYNVLTAFGPTDAIRRSVAAHELQHAVQSIEGFAKGGSVGDFTEQMKAAVAKKRAANVTPELIAARDAAIPAAREADAFMEKKTCGHTGRRTIAG
ncbi:hypothetical protein [Caudoviricetes sp.]|nr:hypothetical protein [Caudoviricetes sp.]